MVDTDNKSIRSRTSFDRLIDRESNHIFFEEMSCYAHMEYGSTSLQGKMIILDVFYFKCPTLTPPRPVDRFPSNVQGE